MATAPINNKILFSKTTTADLSSHGSAVFSLLAIIIFLEVETLLLPFVQGQLPR
jgi:hypothetical protein